MMVEPQPGSSADSDRDSSAATTTTCVPADDDRDSCWSVMLELPRDILVRHILQPYLSPRDLCAARQASSLFRQLANAAVTSCVLDAHTDNTQADAQIPASFINLQQLRISCSPPTEASATKHSSTSSSRLEQLQEQLHILTGKLPQLAQLVYEGPRDRRQQGLNMTAALKALLLPPAQAAAVAALSEPQSTQQQQQQEQGNSVSSLALRVLELTAGSLPDSLMEAVGALTGLVSLKLTATAAIHMAPVAQLTALTAVTLTVTPPLPSALAPLARCSRLAQLQLSALSPARGWGLALARLAPCRHMAHLTLTFADVGDEDMQHMAAALTGLCHLNLNYSRHLTPGAVPHLASLPRLQHLHLLETGLTLRHQELATLGRGCRQLETLEAAFDLRGAAAAAATATSSSSSWPQLRQVVLSGVSAADFERLLAGFTELQALTLNNIGLNGEQIVGHLVSQPPPGLTALSLSQGSAFSQAACAALGSRLPHLRDLTLTDITQQPATLARAFDLLSTHAALQRLTVRRCPWFDDAVLLHGVAKLGSSLQELQLLGCEQVTSAGVLALADRLPRLARLVVRHCPLVAEGTGWDWERRVAAAAGVGEGGGSGRQSWSRWPCRQVVVIDTCGASGGAAQQ